MQAGAHKLEVRGENHELTFGSDGVIRLRVWKRPDLTAAQGAICAKQIEGVLKQWLTLSPAGLIYDARQAPKVAGPKTLATLETWFGAYGGQGLPVAVVVAGSPIQRMQFSRLLSSAAQDDRQLVCDAAGAAESFVRRAIIRRPSNVPRSGIRHKPVAEEDLAPQQGAKEATLALGGKLGLGAHKPGLLLTAATRSPIAALKVAAGI